MAVDNWQTAEALDVTPFTVHTCTSRISVQLMLQQEG
jgi:hypothetical protein